MLQVKKTKSKGRGVFTLKNIPQHKIVENSPVLLLPNKITDNDLAILGLDHYCYDFNGKTAIALGFGSLFNHSSKPNCDWFIDEKNNCIVYSANRTILAYEEITIDYGVEVWFDIKE